QVSKDGRHVASSQRAQDDEARAQDEEERAHDGMGAHGPLSSRQRELASGSEIAEAPLPLACFLGRLLRGGLRGRRGLRGLLVLVGRGGGGRGGAVLLVLHGRGVLV